MQLFFQQVQDEGFVGIIHQIYVLIGLICYIGIPVVGIYCFVLLPLGISVQKCSENVSGAERRQRNSKHKKISQEQTRFQQNVIHDLYSLKDCLWQGLMFLPAYLRADLKLIAVEWPKGIGKLSNQFVQLLQYRYCRELMEFIYPLLDFFGILFKLSILIIYQFFEQ